MKAYKLIYLIVFCNVTISFAQHHTEGKYFPKEQLVHPDCAKSTIESNKCLYELVENNVNDAINYINYDAKKYPDTLTVRVEFTVNKKGKINKKHRRLWINNKEVYQKVSEKLHQMVDDFPLFQVKNYKEGDNFAFHIFKYSYVKKNATATLENITPQENIYTGGDVIQLPMFTTCKGVGFDASVSCLNKGISDHVSQNFGYRDYIAAHNLKGKIYVIFSIEEDRSIKIIRVEGMENAALREHAESIIKSLPEIKPSTKNGKPIKFTYSMPFIINGQ